MAKAKNEKYLIIVHSIKGGSGKSTISLALAQYFGKNAPGKVCYIDTDIAGVGTIALIGKDNKPGQSLTNFIMVNPFDNPQFFKTDFEDAPASLFKEFVHCPDDSMYRHFNAIFCSDQQDDMNHALQATADMFFSQDVEKKMKVLLGKLYGDGIDTIIIDTSPGMQGLTQVIFKIAKDTITNGLHISNDFQLNVIHVCVLTNNFAHIGGLWKFLYDERKYYFEDEQKSKFLLVLNQVPLGVEFKSVPDADMYFDQYQIDEIKQDDPIVTKTFAGHLKGTVETYGSQLIHRAFREYFGLKARGFLPDCFELIEPMALEVKNIDRIGVHVLVIPDQPDIRRIASNFGKVKEFEVSQFFELLEKQCETGHLRILGNRVKEIAESKMEKK